jgi:hypothetical protein
MGASVDHDSHPSGPGQIETTRAARKVPRASMAASSKTSGYSSMRRPFRRSLLCRFSSFCFACQAAFYFDHHEVERLRADLMRFKDGKLESFPAALAAARAASAPVG